MSDYCDICGEELGSSSHYHCCVCGEVCGLMGHPECRRPDECEASGVVFPPGVSGYRVVDGKVTVSVEYLDWLQEERMRFNNANLRDVVLTKGGKPLAVAPGALEDFIFTGLSNMDFVLTGFYEGKNT